MKQIGEEQGRRVGCDRDVLRVGLGLGPLRRSVAGVRVCVFGVLGEHDSNEYY